jgi:hypothetical protein
MRKEHSAVEEKEKYLFDDFLFSSWSMGEQKRNVIKNRFFLMNNQGDDNNVQVLNPIDFIDGDLQPDQRA